MKRIVLILAVIMLVFGFSCGCSKKKQAPVEPNQPKQTQMADANSKADINNPMLNRAVQKTTESQSAERRPRD
jgi:PBP1b-binding outer membrane lipoprotein LpoB